MKISVLTSNFSNNCFGRAWLLAKLLQRHYDVEIIGPALGDGIWSPLEGACDFETKMVKGYPNGQFEFRKLLKMVSGDVIYASKPLAASFGVGLVKKMISREPLVLDVDDWELGFRKELYDSLVWPKKISDSLLSISNWGSYHFTMILDKLIPFADAITVSSRILQARYGGTVIRHGRDVHMFNPNKFNRKKLREKHLRVKNDEAFVIGFIGTPRPHKGLEDIIDIMKLLRNNSFLLIVVGVDGGSYCRTLKKTVKDLGLNNRVVFFLEQHFKTLPEFLTITDLVIIPQRETPTSYGQVPAKIFDAMAMAKPIIATNVSDIPEILKDCGWILEPGNPKQLAETIEYVFHHPLEAKEMGHKAREKCKKEYSWYRMQQRLIPIFEKHKTK